MLILSCTRLGTHDLSLLDLTPEHVTLGGGTELHYVRQGTGSPLIFIHGAMGDYRAFQPQWKPFTASFDCITYSRRYSFPNKNKLVDRKHNALIDAEDLLGLMDHLEIEQAILVGSSYGGFTALALAASAPARVTALVAVEAPMMRYVESDEGRAIVEEFRKSTVLPARDAFERDENELGARILTGGIVGEAPTAVPDHVMQRRMVNLMAARSLALSDDEFPLLDPQVMANLKMPIFLISGAETAPVHAEIFKAVTAAMPQAQSLIVEGSGHSVSQQAAEHFNVAVLNFLAESVESAA